MASVTLYDQFYVSVDGQLLAENQELSISLEGDDQDVMTIVKGFAGETPSPKKVVVSLKNAVPSTGFEFDFWGAALRKSKHKLRLQSASTGKSLTSEGSFRKPKIEAGVGKSVQNDVEFHGGPGDWQ
jgi:hypothetical protein